MSQYTAEDIADAKKRGKENHLTKNYNFAGPGTFYAARMKGSDYYEGLMKAAGRKVVGTKPYNKPYDTLDACGVPHDKVFNNPNATSDEIRKADNDFEKCALKAALTSGVSSEKVRSMVAAGGFELKKRLEDVGVLRKGSWAAGGETTGEQIKRVGKKVLKGVGRFLVGASGAYLGMKGGQAIANKGTKHN